MILCMAKEYVLLYLSFLFPFFPFPPSSSFASLPVVASPPPVNRDKMYDVVDDDDDDDSGDDIHQHHRTNLNFRKLIYH